MGGNPTTPKPPKKTNNSPKAPEDPPIRKAPILTRPPEDRSQGPECSPIKKAPDA